MKYAILALKILLLSYLSYLLYFLITAYDPVSAGYRPPFVIFVLDTINLFIHEAGHFFLKPLGMWVHVIGGSLFQILLPLALVIVIWRKNADEIVYPGFWLGENLVNVGVYIRDAPYKQLRLIARGLIHDWNWLLSGNMEIAEPLSDAVFVAGLILCAASLVVGIWSAVQTFKEVPNANRP